MHKLDTIRARHDEWIHFDWEKGARIVKVTRKQFKKFDRTKFDYDNGYRLVIRYYFSYKLIEVWHK